MSETNTGKANYNKIINYCLYGLVFLLPLLFTTFTFELFEFNKQTLLVVLLAVMLGAWLIKIITTRSVAWKKTSLDYVLLAYLLVYLVSSVLSIDRVSSFQGYFGRFTGSFISVFAFVALYFLLVHNLQTERTVKRIVAFLTASFGLVLTLGLLQILGVYILPIARTQTRAFSPLGSVVGLSIFAALGVILFLWYSKNAHTKFLRVVALLMTLVALAILFLLNTFVAWLILCLGLIVHLAFLISRPNNESIPFADYWEHMVVLVVAILFLAFQFLPSSINPRNLVRINVPAEIQLSSKTSWNIVSNSISAGVKKAIIGSGPGTFGVAYGSIKPQNLNQTIAWSLVFDRLPSEIANIAVETGVLGLLAFEVMSLMFLVYGFLYLRKRAENNPYALGFFTLWIALYAAHFVYFLNTTLYFLFWLSMGSFMALRHMKDAHQEAEESMHVSSKGALSSMFISLLVLAALLVGLFYQVALFGAEVSYASGLKQLDPAKRDLDKAQSDFLQSIRLNPTRDVYYLAYAQTLRLKASAEAVKKTPDVKQINSWMQGLITAGQQAVRVSPEKASNWAALAQLYTGVKPLVSGTDQFIMDFLQKAIDKDPNNPALHYQLGQAMYATAIADSAKLNKDLLKKAEDELYKAIELKRDLTIFYIQLARMYEKDSKLDDAKSLLDKAVKLFPNNPDVRFEDGRIAFNQKNYDEAEKSFNQVIVMVPNSANAHFSLGQLYLQKGDKDKALAEFEKAREITGANSDLDTIISNLKG